MEITLPLILFLTGGFPAQAQTFEKISINSGFGGSQAKLTMADLDNGRHQEAYEK